jgi:glycosyltransferase involved in cell wall biosynthesis
VPNFIDMAQFDPDRYDRDSVRESLGLGRGRFVVGFVGRLDRAKGPDLLVEAAALLRDRGDARRFLVVGAGPERERLERRIRKLDVGRIVILAGLHENPAAVMRAFDVGVVPSRREAFGIAALEMMRMRVPVIVSRVGGLPELVRDGRTGILLPQPSPEAIAEAVRRLEKNATLREALGRRACEQASAFDGRQQVQQIVDIYEQLMSTQRRVRGT